MASSLPHELLLDILHRKSLKSLGQLKSINKEWYNLIDDDEFIYDHLDHHSHEVLLRNEYGEQVHIMDPVTENLSISPIPDEFRGRYIIDKMVHCDGLMLCVCISYDALRKLNHEDTKLVIWNPVLRKSKWIDMTSRYRVSDIVGIGYAKGFRNSYKILYHPQTHLDAECKIYEKNKSDSWKTIVGANFDGNVAFNCEGECVKGNMYWIVSKKKECFKEDVDDDTVIVSFDFSDETYKEVCVCPLNGLKRIRSLNGEALSLYRQDTRTSDVQVWVSNKLSDEVVTFALYVEVSYDTLIAIEPRDVWSPPGYSIAISGDMIKVMAWCELLEEEAESINFYKFDRNGLVYTTETRRFEPPLHCYNVFSRTCMFVPSLVPVDSKNRKKYDLQKANRQIPFSAIALVLAAAVTLFFGLLYP